MKDRIIYLENFYKIRIVHTHGLINENADASIPHSHSHCEVFIHVLGDMQVFVGKNAYKVSEGTVRIYASGELHYGKAAENSVAEWYQISLPKDFFNCDLYKELGDVFYNRALNKENVFVSKQNAKLQELAEEIFAARICSVPIAVSNVLKILCILNERSNNAPVYLKFKFNEMGKILSDINENITSIHSLDDLCRITHYSPSYLNRIFKENLNITPYKFILEKKLDSAKKALESGNSVGDACECGGFCDYNNFITLFRKTFGITPGQMKLIKGKNE